MPRNAMLTSKEGDDEDFFIVPDRSNGSSLITIINSSKMCFNREL